MSCGIGILDSGVGGLTVAKEVMRQLPLEEIYYIGDSARCPYGPRPKHEVQAFTHQLIRFLQSFPLKILVIACNTATAAVLDEIKDRFPVPVIGVIEPGARAAVRATKTGRIGVIGTQGTIQSGMYEKVLHRIDPDLEVLSLACPALVPLVELGETGGDKALQIVRQSLASIQNSGIDTLILGCTHYPIIAHLIQEVMGEEVRLISSAEETANEIRAILSSRQQLEQTVSPLHRFFTTGDPANFRRIAERWLGTGIEVRQARLEEVHSDLPLLS